MASDKLLPDETSSDKLSKQCFKFPFGCCSAKILSDLTMGNPASMSVENCLVNIVSFLKPTAPEALRFFFAADIAPRFDIFNLQYRLPRRLLQIPYDILNRMNRKKLLKQNENLTTGITHKDYFIKDADDTCFDLFYIAQKK